MNTKNIFAKKVSGNLFRFLTVSSFSLLITAFLTGCNGKLNSSSSANASGTLLSSSTISVASSESLATACDFPANFSWESTQPLITPKAANHGVMVLVTGK